MKNKIIDLYHHIAGIRGKILDLIFGYHPKHWDWYFKICVKYLNKKP